MHVAARRMFYAGMEVARFLGVSSGAITLANPALRPNFVKTQPCSTWSLNCSGKILKY